MYKFLSKNGVTVAAVLGGVISIAFLVIASSSVPEGLGPDYLKDASGPLMGDALLSKLEGIGSFDLGFYATYAFLILAVAAAVLLSLIYFVTNFSVKSLRTLIPILVLIVVYFIVSSSFDPTADSYVVKSAIKKFGVSTGESKIITGGIYAAGVALASLVASVVITEVVNIFK